jgi:hypothetical protein
MLICEIYGFCEFCGFYFGIWIKNEQNRLSWRERNTLISRCLRLRLAGNFQDVYEHS